LIIDEKIPDVPPFEKQSITVEGKTFDVHFCNIIECIKVLYSNPEFMHNMTYALERHYSDPDMTNRIYSQMHTGKWWWWVQVMPVL